MRSSSDQVLDRLDSGMRDLVARQDMAFIATSDSGGECDARFRAGAPGFIHVLDERTLAYPECRVTGRPGRPGRPSENPHIGILLIDIGRDLLGLHVNGTARIVDDATLRDYVGDLPAGGADAVDAVNDRRPERWVVVSVREAYVQPRAPVETYARARPWAKAKTASGS